MDVFRKITMTAAFALGTAGSFMSICTDAAAVPSVRQNAIDVTVVIESDGKTTVIDRLDFTVSNGPMTALLIENMALTPTYVQAKYELKGKPVVSEVIFTETSFKHWDLEAVPKIPDGDAYLTLQYTGNMISDGYIGKTTSDEHGDLYYFDWAPMQWRTSMTYRRVKIVLPVIVNGYDITCHIIAC